MSSSLNKVEPSLILVLKDELEDLFFKSLPCFYSKCNEITHR